MVFKKKKIEGKRKIGRLSGRLADNIELNIKGRVGRCGFNIFESEQRDTAGHCTLRMTE